MSDLPPGWEWATFSDVAEIASNLVDPADHQDAPHIAPNHIESWTGRLLDFTTVADDRVKSSKHRFFAGQLLYSKIRPYLAKVVAVDFSGLCSADMYPINSYIDKRFLKWWLLTPNFTESASKHQGRSVLPKINARALGTLPVPVAPIAEQQRIVATLEDHLSRLWAGKNWLHKAATRATVMKKAVLEDVFGPAGTEATPEIIRQLGDVVQLASGQTPRGLSELSTDGDSQNAVPFYKVGDMNLGDGRYISTSRLSFSRHDLASVGAHIRPAGTVILPKRGGAIATNKKRILLRDGAYDLNTMGLIPRECLDSRYLWYWLQGIDLARLADGSNVPQINNPDLAPIPIPVPSRDRQTEIVALLDDRFSAIDRVDFGDFEKRGESLRRSLLTDAFAGRLVPQVPHDEPASELLERIRAERAAQAKPRRNRRAKNTNQETLL